MLGLTSLASDELPVKEDSYEGEEAYWGKSV